MVYSRRAVRIDRLRLSGEVLFSTQAGSKEGIYPKFSAHEGRYSIVPFSLADEIWPSVAQQIDVEDLTMKKTKKRALLVIAVVLVLALLLTPIPLGLKDGGSVVFKALVYEVTKIHQLPSEIDADYEYIEGIEVKILGVTVYRKTNH